MKHALALLLCLTACNRDVHPPEDHGDHSHGHDAEDPRPGLVLTLWDAHTELFVEFPALVVGQESRFAAHLTRLSDFAAVNDGTMTAELGEVGAAQPGVGQNARPLSHDLIGLLSGQPMGLRERFVDGVVQHFEHHVVQAGAILSVANIHAGAFANCLQAFQDLDAVRIVTGVGIRYRFLYVRHVMSFTTNCLVPQLLWPRPAAA